MQCQFCQNPAETIAASNPQGAHVLLSGPGTLVNLRCGFGDLYEKNNGARLRYLRLPLTGCGGYVVGWPSAMLKLRFSFMSGADRTILKRTLLPHSEQFGKLPPQHGHVMIVPMARVQYLIHARFRNLFAWLEHYVRHISAVHAEAWGTTTSGVGRKFTPEGAWRYSLFHVLRP
jgi:hypothetical protein